MIGRYTLLWVGLAAGVAAGLFQVKYEVQALEGKLDRINRSILADSIERAKKARGDGNLDELKARLSEMEKAAGIIGQAMLRP